MKTFEQKNGKAKILTTVLFLGSLFFAPTTFAMDSSIKLTLTVGDSKIKVAFTSPYAKPDYSFQAICNDTNSAKTSHSAKGAESPIYVDAVNNHNFTCRIRVLDANGLPTTGIVSDDFGPVTPYAGASTVMTKPDAPQSVGAVALDKQATITWLPPAFDGNTPITKYVVSTSISLADLEKTSRSVESHTAGYGGYSYTYTGLTNDTPYTFYVRSENSVGVSSWVSSGIVTPKVGISTTKGDDGSGSTTKGDDDSVIPSQNGLSINLEFKNPLHQTASDIPSFVAVVLKAVAKLLFPVVVIMILYSGFLFVIARGNIEKIGDAKKALTYAIVGAAIVLGAYGLAQLVQGILVSIVS